MSDATPLLALPLLQAAQAQKHVTHNEALLGLDTLVQLAVLDKDRLEPPASPAEGDRYLIAGASPSGAWTGWAGRIVRFQDGAWRSFVPRPGWFAWVTDEADLYTYTGGAWVGFRATLTALQNLARLGIGTTADAANPFAAKLNAALWTALARAEGGTGDLRYTLNKDAPANTLSLLFQSGWSGRAEIGLTGDDDLHLKVSADGSAWIEALRIDRSTGGLVAGPLAAGALTYGKASRLPAATNLDTLTTAGFYDGAQLVNAPTAEWWYIEVQTHSNSSLYALQRATRLNDAAARETWQRVRVAGRWSSWDRLWTSASFDPTTKMDKAGGSFTAGITVPGAVAVSGLAGEVAWADRWSGAARWVVYAAGGPLRVYRDDTGDLFWFTEAGFHPSADNAKASGLAPNRWSTVYAATGSINTSDAREKTGVAPLTEAELAWASDLAKEIGTFQFLSAIAEKGAEGARHHIGLTVQRAIALGQARGLDPFRYAFICYDKWDAEPEVSEPILGEDGEPSGETRVLSPARPAGDRYGFRPDQLALFIARGQEARLAALEARLS
ncbi:DUF2793 domain-containing protein [Methylobacterium nodulans]|uniref:Peptidase S74 domain-containing protein n=1 Tax=Methylobacterium nodulans (strain LMG 21967 / CNCM I-2342 / ORS 2060) TaxID=460265 RepID=B8IDH8_METNO|nr:DUF2793 domain-containing protein [Methylobacterium nodulans]ACL61344.1 hypothetical protein Mnod_6575 [Methylobacterium nodulans ORS 2060]ACL62050.1 hypothetical protein Mnod_7311 [Methylobacterium nodulans ORS 2060]